MNTGPDNVRRTTAEKDAVERHLSLDLGQVLMNY